MSGFDVSHLPDIDPEWAIVVEVTACHLAWQRGSSAEGAAKSFTLDENLPSESVFEHGVSARPVGRLDFDIYDDWTGVAQVHGPARGCNECGGTSHNADNNRIYHQQLCSCYDHAWSVRGPFTRSRVIGVDDDGEDIREQYEVWAAYCSCGFLGGNSHRDSEDEAALRALMAEHLDGKVTHDMDARLAHLRRLP